MSELKKRRITLVWSYGSLLRAVAQAFEAGDIAKVRLEWYTKDYWQRAIWAGVEAVVLREGQMIEMAVDSVAGPEARAATDAIWERMRDV